MDEPGLEIPRIDMHMCSASMTTMTPLGIQDLGDSVGDLPGQTLLDLGAPRVASTRRASFDKPVTTPPRGM